MMEKIGRLIAAKLGRVIEVKTDEEGLGIGACLAVRVEIDVWKQLLRRMRVVVEEDQAMFVDFKYERLPALCYCCGIIGHNDSDCGVAIRKMKEGVANPAQFRKWIRAPIRKKGLRDKGGYGGRSGGAFQDRVVWKGEDRFASRDGESKESEEVTAVEVRGKNIIPKPIIVEGKNSSKGNGFLEKSKDRAEEERGPPPIGTDGPNKIILGRGEAHNLTGEITRAPELGMGNVQRAKEKNPLENDGPIKTLGRGYVHSPKGAITRALELVMGHVQPAKEKKSLENGPNGGTRSSQNIWKRRSRDEDVMKENKDQQTLSKPRKRGVKEAGLMAKDEEEMEKRRKVLGTPGQ